MVVVERETGNTSPLHDGLSTLRYIRKDDKWIKTAHTMGLWPDATDANGAAPQGRAARSVDRDQQ